MNFIHANLEVISARNGAEALRKAFSEQPDVIVLNADLPDLDNSEVCRQLKESPETCHIPIILIGETTPPFGQTLNLIKGADSYITKPFDPKEVVALVQTYLRRKERAEDIDIQTGLANGIQLNREITRLIEENKSFTAIYLDIERFSLFNQAFGFTHGNQAIRLLGDIAGGAVKRLGNPDDMAGHLGGDDFMIVTTARKAKSLCRRIIAEFDRQKQALYPQEDLDEQRAGRTSRANRHEKHPVISLHAAVITNEKRLFHHFFEVIKAAHEQLNRLKSYPGSLSYFDIADGDIEADAGIFPAIVLQEYREDSRRLPGVLAWLTALTGDVKNSVTATDKCLQSIGCEKLESRSSRGRSLLTSASQSLERLTRIIEVLEGLITVEYPLVSSVPDEVNLDELIKWIVEQLRPQAGQRGISVEIQTSDSAEQFIVDCHSLVQSLQYLLKAAIEMSAPGDRLQIGIAERNDEFITLQISNPHRYTKRAILAKLERNPPKGRQPDTLEAKLYLAKLLVQGLGGKLDITSEKEQGTAFKVIFPRKWRSWMHELNALVFAASVSRKQARAELEDIQQLILAPAGKVPAALEDSLAKLRSRVQELGILCNRSLYLAEDFNSRLEKQQERWLQQETEQLSTLEAVLTISHEMAQHLHAGGHFFDVESAHRVAKNALAIADEFNLSPEELKELQYAALLKDLGLALSAQHVVKQTVVASIEEAIVIRTFFKQVWNTLSMVPFLTKALDIVVYRNEKYDGSNGRFGVKGVNIPLGARILAVADTFDLMTSGLSPDITLIPSLAVKKIMRYSGTYFDPDVVNAFLRVWKRKELCVAVIDNTSS